MHQEVKWRKEKERDEEVIDKGRKVRESRDGVHEVSLAIVYTVYVDGGGRP